MLFRSSGLLPTPNTSNDYFFQAAIQCRKDGLTQNEAQDKIKIVFDQWKKTAHYSGRPWANIETKINQVYESENFEQSDRLEKFVKTAQIALDFSSSRQIYSNVDTHDIFENKNGFLERINNNLKKELQVLYPTMSKENYNDILFKLEGLAKPIPETNKNLIVFKNGVLDRKQRKIIDTDEIADLGFKEFNYLKATESNKPKKFIEIMFSNVRLEEHPRIKAGLKAIFNNRLDSRISVIYGISGVGKSTPLSILVKILGQYALSVELDQFLKDRFIKAKIIGKRLVVLEDLPKDWKDFAQIKTVTGEAIKTERGFLQDSVQFENKIKIWASGNYLTKIPEHEKNAMYSRRLSLIHNDKTAQYVENPGLIDEVVRDEGEKIISWIVNLPEEECQYEDSFTVRTEWEAIASPEMEYLEENYEITEEIDKKIPVYSLVKNFRDAKKLPMDLKTMGHALESVGYIVHYNIIKNIQIKEKFLNKLA